MMLDMITKFVGLGVGLLGFLMIAMGAGVATIPNITPPMVTGVGFLLITYAILNHRH